MRDEASIRTRLDRIEEAWRQDDELFAPGFIQLVRVMKELFKELDETRIERDALRYRLGDAMGGRR